jgi:hypothetical protein
MGEMPPCLSRLGANGRRTFPKALQSLCQFCGGCSPLGAKRRISGWFEAGTRLTDRIRRARARRKNRRLCPKSNQAAILCVQFSVFLIYSAIYRINKTLAERRIPSSQPDGMDVAETCGQTEKRGAATCPKHSTWCCPAAI